MLLYGSDSGSSVLILNFRWQNLNGGNGTACTFTFSPRRFSRQLQTPTKYIFLECSLIGESIGWSFVHFTATSRCPFVKTGQNFRVPADRWDAQLRKWHHRILGTKKPLVPPLLKPNVTQYRSGSTVNVNCNGCKSNNAVISENNVLFLQKSCTL